MSKIIRVYEPSNIEEEVSFKELLYARGYNFIEGNEGIFNNLKKDNERIYKSCLNFLEDSQILFLSTSDGFFKVVR
jgi:hypothetical protein